jgi:hypothetical protein
MHFLRGQGVLWLLASSLIPEYSNVGPETDGAVTQVVSREYDGYEAEYDWLSQVNEVRYSPQSNSDSNTNDKLARRLVLLCKGSKA